VTLKHLLQRRPAIVPQSSGGEDNAQLFSPMKALALLSTLQSADIVLPTTDGREIRLRRTTEPTAEQKSLLHQLGLELPERFQLKHPLDGLTAPEIWTAYEVLQSSGKVGRRDAVSDGSAERATERRGAGLEAGSVDAEGNRSPW
jgi:hypothetical protein